MNTVTQANPNTPPASAAPQKVSSARVRIVLWILATVLLTIFAVVLTTRTLLLTNVESHANRQVEQEVAEFINFLDEGRDPATAEPFTDTARLFQVYLARQIPEPSESLLAVIDGRTMEIQRQNETQPATISAILADQANSGVYHTAEGERVHWARVDIVPEAGGKTDHYIVAKHTGADVARVNNEITTIALVGVGGTAIAAIIAWLIAGQLLLPSRQIRNVAVRITETDLSARVPLTGTDESRELAASFNSMLDRIESLTHRQAKFVDDAGHELRTPITVIRGQLELLDLNDPVQAQRSVDLSIAELDRMTRIVNELLTLAVADQHDFVVPEPVDVADLTIELEDKISVMADRKFTLTEVAETTAALDRQRITQAMLEIVSNAVRHTADGAGIEFGSRVGTLATNTPGSNNSDSQATVEFFVRDHGPGIAPELLPTLFDRFTQHGSNGRQKGGAGLGLSIVKAIMDAHHGSVRVESQEGEGTTFTLVIPLTNAASQTPTQATPKDTPEATTLEQETEA